MFSDIDECNTMKNPCNITWTCQNSPGNYSCYCPHGYKGDGYNKGQGCTLESNKLLVTEAALGKNTRLQLSDLF